MKKLTMALVGAIGVLAPVAASADFSASVALTSDYRFRGISQNSREIAEQGSVTWSQDGYYVGTWASKIDWNVVTPGNPSIEVDIFGGKHFDLDGTDLNVEAYYYAYPDFNNFGVIPKASYFEGIAQLSHTFDALTLTGTFAWSPEFSLGGGDGEYLEGTASYAVNDWLSISGNVGHQWVAAAPSDYTHWDVGATASWHNFALDARYVDTDIGAGACAGFWMGTPHACSGGFVGTITYNIQNFP
jgi:uncharacterized protein (TIGR02001 family)